MADLTIFQLTQILPAAVDQTNDLLPLWDDSATETKKITVADFKTLVAGAVNWSESFSSATQATSQWTPNNAAANVNAAISPKGTGALVAQIPTGTIVGGNARGQSAVDWQMSRSNANQVASGNYATIGGGANNRVTGASSTVFGGSGNVASGDGSVAGGASCSATNTNSVAIGAASYAIGPYSVCFGYQNSSNSWYSVVGGGLINTANAGADGTAVLSGGFNSAGGSWSCVAGGSANASGTFCFVGAGQSNTAGGSHSVCAGGQSNTANASWATIGGGNGNQATGNYSVSVGGFQNLATAQYATVKGGALAEARLYGQQAFAAGRFSANGDAQAHELIWRREITGTSQTELFLDGASVRAILPGTNSIWQGIIDISAICTNAGGGTTVVGDVAATSYKVTIKRIGTNTVLVGTVQEIGTTNSDISMGTSVFTIDNDNTNESLRLQFTPPTTANATTVIRVLATFRGTQLQY